MSVAFFGIVRSKPKIEAQPKRRVADFTEVWSRRLERLGELVEAGSAEWRQAESI